MVTTLDWPGNSTDLNPIKVCLLKEFQRQPANSIELMETIKEVWVSTITFWSLYAGWVAMETIHNGASIATQKREGLSCMMLYTVVM